MRLIIVGMLFCGPSVSVRAQTLGEALNATNLVWTTSGTGGSTGWIATSGSTHDGVLAAASASIGSGNRSSVLQTTIEGPGTLTFWWRAPTSSFIGNTLSFVVGTNTITNITGSIGIPASLTWQKQTVYLAAGTQALKWIYSSGSSPDGQRGYLDEVMYYPGTTAPFIVAEPKSQSHLCGLDVTFSVHADGTPPLDYQWKFNGTNITDAKTASLTISNIQPFSLGVYSVVVTNSGGSTNSAGAVLEFGAIAGWGFAHFGATAIPAGATNVLAISAGAYHSAALRAGGDLAGWGLNNHGQTTSFPDKTNIVALVHP